MKKIVSMFAVFALVGALSIGCNKPNNSTPEGGGGTPAKKNWEPETHKHGDGGDHSGHDHGPGGHSH